MHPAVRGFSERHPRMYGLLMLSAAFALSIGWKRLGVPAISLSLFLALAGVLYLVFGDRAAKMDRMFVSRFDPQKLSWRYTLPIVLLAALVLALAVFIQSAVGH